MANELTIKGQFDIAKPSQMVAMAKVLKTHIVRQKLYTEIVGKNYVHIEGWQFAGGLLGIYPRVESAENLSNGQEIKWRVDVSLLRGDQIVARGIAICSNKESKKRTFDEYAILSMAQTRAIGKAYRNLLGWVIKLTGYESTPAEEMFKIGEIPKTPPAVTTQAPNTPQPKERRYECREGAEYITKAEYEYSKRIFGKPLCREHQKEARQKHARR